MKRTNMVWTMLLVTTLLVLGVAAAYAQAGETSLIVVNYVGKELSFTLDGVQHTVPAASADQGGQTTFALAPGKHEYSGGVPGGPGAGGLVELATGQTFVLGARVDTTPARISPEGEVLEQPRDVLIFFEASLNPPAAPAAATRVPLQAIPTGQGALVLDNYIGEEMVLDIQGTTYPVPADGRLQVNLAPGEYAYSASAGLSGTSDSAVVTAAQYTGLGFSREVLPEPTYEVGEPEPTVAIPRISVSPVDLSSEVVVEVPTISTEAPAAAPQPADDNPSLTVINYAPQALTFTINNVIHEMAENGGQVTMSLAPGEYTYTASTPRTSMNGSLVLKAGDTQQLSLATQPDGSEIRAYLE